MNNFNMGKESVFRIRSDPHFWPFDPYQHFIERLDPDPHFYNDEPQNWKEEISSLCDGAEKPAGEKKPRKPRKRKEPDYAAQLQEEVEEEVLRSGRKRKVRRVMTHFMEGSDEDDKGRKCYIIAIARNII